MIHATLDLRSYEGPLTCLGRTLDELFCCDEDVQGTIADGRGESFHLSGKWRVVSRQVEASYEGECHVYSLERVP
jgi:hypothetical protein